MPGIQGVADIAQVGAPLRARPVTIENLLTHTSGIANYTALPGFPSVMKTGVGVDEGVRFFQDAPPEFAPGKRLSYSNSNYFLLGAIIEKVSGVSYGDFMEQQIFRPLQVASTRIESDASPDAQVSGYTRARRRVVSAAYYSMSWPYAAGALRTNVDDLARWDRAMTEGKRRFLLRVVAAASSLLLVGFALIVLTRAGLAFAEWYSVSRALIWIVVGYCVLGVIANAATRSRRERLLWLPVVAAMLILSIVVALG